MNIRNLFKKQTTERTFIPIMTETLSGYNSHFAFDNDTDYLNAYYNVPELASIINYISNSLSSGDWSEKLKDKNVNGSKLVNLLNNPHPIYTNTEFKKIIAKHLLLFGRCHLFVNEPKINTAKGLFILPTWLVNANLYKEVSFEDIITANNAGDYIKNYSIKLNNEKLNFPTEIIITIFYNSDFEINIQSDKINYKSPLQSLGNALKTSPAVWETFKTMNNNRGAVGILSSDSDAVEGFSTNVLTEEEKKEIQKAYRKYGTLGNQWQMLITSAKLKYQKISAPLKEMLLPEQLSEIKRIIADVYNFDTILLNNADANKYANYREARKSFFNELIFPFSDNITNAINNYFYKFRENKIYLDFSANDIFQKDLFQKEQINLTKSQIIINLNTSVSNGSMTRNNAIEFLILAGYEKETANKLIQ